MAAALDAVKAGVVLPWGSTKAPTEGATSDTPPTSTTDTPSEDGARVLLVEKDTDALDEPPASTDANSTSPETEATPERSLRVLSLSNFEKALKEITPSSSESLGTLSELRKWNDEFGEGKREKKRNMWGKGSFGFIEKGEGQSEIKIATGAGAGVVTSGNGGGRTDA